MRKSYVALALKEDELTDYEVKKLKSLSQSTIVKLLKLRHPIECTRTLNKQKAIAIFREARWFPNDDELK